MELSELVLVCGSVRPLCLLCVCLLLLACERAAPPAPPVGMVLVPAGTFLTGSDDPDADSDLRPLRKARVPAFYIDKTEVTNDAVKSVWPEHQFPAGEGQLPATGFTRAQAAEILAKMGKRLPTALEWEKAGRGEDGRSYPWGNEYRPELAHVGKIVRDSEGCALNPGLKPVGSFPGGESPYGCLDMVGNAWEWVADDGPDGFHLIKGGAFGYSAHHNRLYGAGLEQPGIT